MRILQLTTEAGRLIAIIDLGLLVWACVAQDRGELWRICLHVAVWLLDWWRTSPRALAWREAAAEWCRQQTRSRIWPP